MLHPIQLSDLSSKSPSASITAIFYCITSSCHDKPCDHTFKGKGKVFPVLN